MVSFDNLCKNHPGRNSSPCSFLNQCAVRMGIALQKSGVNMNTFKGAKCGNDHSPRHVLRAQELAIWLKDNDFTFGKVQVFERAGISSFRGFKGIVFIEDGWGSSDHIDLWNGVEMKAGDAQYFELGKKVWFWNFTNV